MLGLHSLVGESFAPEQLDFNSPPMTSLKKWWKLKKEVLEGKHALLQVPRMKDILDWDNVKFASARASKENSLPDPYSMAVKAAINFSAIIAAKVMPACLQSSMSDMDGKINSNQDDDTQLPHDPQQLNLSLLLQPTQSVF